MRCFIAVASLCAAILSPMPALAGPDAEVLGACLADNTSGKDRKDLARWIFLAMAAHPDLRDLTAADDRLRTDSNKGMASLVTRLLTVDCVVQARTAVQSEGGAGMSSAFKSLGELAMRELMSNPNVTAAVMGYTPFIDRKKFEAAMTPGAR